MNRDSLEKMRLDRRLMRRRGWIGNAELEQAMQSLPDSAEKATTLGEASDSGAPEGDDASGATPPLS